MTFPRVTPHDPDGVFVDTPGGPAHVVVDGDLSSKRVLAFVHGIPGNTRDARYLGPALAQRGLACVRLDMPGFGKTARTVMPHVSALDRAAFVRWVMRALGCDSFAVAGHSIGGAVALACAARYPDDVQALVLVNSVGVTRHRGLVLPATMHRAMARVASSAEFVGGAMARMLNNYYEGRGTRSENEIDAATFAHHIHVVGALDFMEQRARTRRIVCPTLVVTMDDDRFVEPQVGEQLVRALSPFAPLVTHLRAKEGGHHGQKVAAVPIAQWVEQTVGPRERDGALVGRSASGALKSGSTRAGEG